MGLADEGLKKVECLEEVAPNFTFEEIRCPCCNEGGVDLMFLRRLQVLRDMLGWGFTCTPGGFYRCTEYNSTLSNASPNSQHLFGRAMDVTTHGWTGKKRRQFIKTALSLGFSVGDYSAHIHIDLRKSEPTSWHGKY